MTIGMMRLESRTCDERRTVRRIRGALRRHAMIALLIALSCQAIARSGDLPPLIPRSVLFGNPDRSQPRLSPDGRQLAYLAPDEGVLNVWVRTLGRKDDRAVTRDRDRGVRSFFWAPNAKQILFVQDQAGEENWHLFSVDLASNEVRDLTPFDGVQARIVAVDPHQRESILVGLNRRDPALHDVYRLNLQTGELTLEAQNDEGFVGWVADHDLVVRAGVRVTPDGGAELLYRSTADSAWKTVQTWGPADTLGSGAIAFAPGGRDIYTISSVGCNTGELRILDPMTGQETKVARDLHADVADLLIDPISHAIQAVGFRRERLHWKILDRSIKKDFSAIKRIRRGDFKIIDRDRDDRHWLVRFTADDGPVSFHLYDRTTRHAELLFTNREALKGLRLARMRPISFRAHDGLLIHGYLTTPPGIRARNLPTVLNVRAGPWSRDTWGYDGRVQWLANRGYAVLQINFRGSRGYGKRFLNAGDREWGGKMHSDLIQGVSWAVRKGITDPKRVAIFGSLYGGYAALVGLTFTPDVFCCGVDISGPSNLITWIKNFPPYWKPIEPLLWDRVGHPEKDAAFLKTRSPLFYVDRITSPLLIAQGANDPRVKRSEALQIVEALKKAGRVVEYVEYPDEGHGFARPENRLDFYAKAERFLAQHLGGRYEE